MITWIILRAAGIGAYLMLFGSVAFGLVATSAPFGKRIAKQSATLIHQFLSTVGLVLLGVHIGGLLLDTYIHFGAKEVLVPLASTYRPFAVALGVLGMYATVLVLVSSWVRRQYAPKLWRTLHMAAVPAFGLCLLHGLFAGADATRRWMFLTYVMTASVVVFLLVLRGLTVGMRPERRTQSSPRPEPPPESSPRGVPSPAPGSSESGDGERVDGPVVRSRWRWDRGPAMGTGSCRRLGERSGYPRPAEAPRRGSGSPVRSGVSRPPRKLRR